MRESQPSLAELTRWGGLGGERRSLSPGSN